MNGAAEANIYNDPEAAQIVFNAGWVVTMIGSDVGERTLITRKCLAELQASYGPQSDFIAKIADFYLTRGEKSGYSGAAMYDPLAVGIALDPTLGTLKEMHVDVCGDEGRVPLAERPSQTAWDRTRTTCCMAITMRSRASSNSSRMLASALFQMPTGFSQLFVSRIKGK